MSPPVPAAPRTRASSKKSKRSNRARIAQCPAKPPASIAPIEVADSLLIAGPERLALEWLSPIEPSYAGHDPSNTSAAANFRVAWRCHVPACRFEFVETVSVYAAEPACPRCTGRIVIAEETLASAHPEIADEWRDPVDEVYAALTPENTYPGSPVRVRWRCSGCRSEYEASVRDRTSGRVGCACQHSTLTAERVRKLLAAEWPQLARAGAKRRRNHLSDLGLLASTSVGRTILEAIIERELTNADVRPWLEGQPATAVEQVISEHSAARWCGGRERISERLRELILAHYGSVCRCCGSTEEIQIDHIHPVALGGATTPENLQPLCGPCNRHKSDRPLSLQELRLERELKVYGSIQ